MEPTNCPNCGQSISPSETRCSSCGEIMETTLPVRDKDELQEKLTEAQRGADKATDQISSTIKTDPDVSFGNARVTDILVLTQVETGAIFSVNTSELGVLVVGRQIKRGDDTLSLDVIDLGGPVSSVSRRHATISREDNFLVLKDAGSTNGTYLNGKRLQPEQVRIIRHEDKIHLGDFALVVAFK